ncbi:MAG: BatD family protein [Candidatus Hodarchaeales archaeon]|jgi:uncharacterized repeat protein (TIGR01451 family)
MLAVPKRSQLGRKIIISFFFAILCFNYMSAQVQASSSRTTNVSALYPSIFVTKNVDFSDVTLNDSFIVTITITNIGNSTAYNVTFTENLNAPWVFNVTGLTKISYSWIEPNQTRRFSYIATALTIGEYQLHSAQVSYRISELSDTEFVAFSNTVNVAVNKVEKDLSLANMSSAITFLLILIILNSILTLRFISPRFNRKKA